MFHYNLGMLHMYSRTQSELWDKTEMNIQTMKAIITVIFLGQFTELYFIVLVHVKYKNCM